uniref:Uncharacterized protein n=1 Tax=Ditylenchus dipsaci TaxID=166011 RepID=A0A915EH05_9BILA
MNIQKAFQRAVEGTKCLNCQRRFHHAVYQRHREACMVETSNYFNLQRPEASFLTITTPIKSLKETPRCDKKPSKKPLKRLTGTKSTSSNSGSVADKKPYLTYASLVKESEGF